LALVVGLSATNAAAQVTPFNPKDWSERPSEAEIAAAWPSQAKAGVYQATVALECASGSDGALSDCAVAKEDPEGQGFGAAGLGLAGKFAMKRPRGGKFYILLNFRAPGFTAPDWLKRPRAEDLMAVWPTAAMKAGKGGRAVIDCMVNVQGGLFDCKVVAEAPEGANFGGAAIALTPQLLMRPASLNGKPVVSTVRIPINFEWPNESQTGTRTAGGAIDDSDMKTVVDPARSWAAAPAYSDVVAAYPEKAKAASITGKATLSCGFNAQGGLKACEVIAEEPQGQGFGRAAKDLTALFRADPGQAKQSDLSGLLVQLPVTFAAQMLSSEKPVIGKPRWVQLPSAEEVGDAYPDAARKASIWTGRAALACLVQSDGKVACSLDSEAPAGYGFGEAAMRIAPHFRLATWTTEGLPVVGGKVRIPIRFEAPEQEPKPPAAPAP
jgi:TonB family protein